GAHDDVVVAVAHPPSPLLPVHWHSLRVHSTMQRSFMRCACASSYSVILRCERSEPRRMRPRCAARPGRRPPISGLPEIGLIVRKSAKADLRWLGRRQVPAPLAPQGDGHSWWALLHPVLVV